MPADAFRKKVLLDAEVADVFTWHARPGAIMRLSPPWDPIELISQVGGIKKDARVVLKMRAGPFRYLWHARHTAYQEKDLFIDEQDRGPFTRWKHTHRFWSTSRGQCLLEDDICYQLPFSTITQPLARPFIHHMLGRIFAYRHRVTAADLALQLKYREAPPKTVLISGASGLIGARLIPLLTTGGHTVLTLVRRPPKSETEIFWDPTQNRIDMAALNAQPIDAVIHLAGENVATGRWTPAKKETIVNSRTQGTALLVKAMSQMDLRPATFLSASAIGLYGDRQDDLIDESGAPGNDFLSSVCAQWEAAALPAADLGIRTVLMRIGVVLTPEGGALQRFLPVFFAGLGGRVGNGRQHLSWISIDDALRAIYHLLMEPSTSGPFNLVSPYPVTNREFTRTLARVLRRPAMLPVPARAIKLAMGQMGEEVALTSTRVAPTQLLASGFDFCYPKLETALRHLLGRLP